MQRSVRIAIIVFTSVFVASQAFADDAQKTDDSYYSYIENAISRINPWDGEKTSESTPRGENLFTLESKKSSDEDESLINVNGVEAVPDDQEQVSPSAGPIAADKMDAPATLIESTVKK
jgi:hypothetical protein